MREPNLLIISNKFEEENLEEDIKPEFVRWDCSPNELPTFSDYHVVIIDFSFDNDDELNEIDPGIYSLLGERLFSIIKGLIVIVICGYPNKKVKVSVLYPTNSDDSQYSHYKVGFLIDENFKKVSIENRNSYIFLAGPSEGPLEGIYKRLFFEQSHRYDKKVNKLFKKYFNLTDKAYFIIKYSPSPLDVNIEQNIEPISKTAGFGRDHYCVGALISIENGAMILLPSYIKDKKNEALSSLIEISKKIYKKQKRLKSGSE